MIRVASLKIVGAAPTARRLATPAAIVAALALVLSPDKAAHSEGGDGQGMYALLTTGAVPIAHQAPARLQRPEVRRAVAAEARRQGVPVHLAHAVAHIESRHRCNVIGPRTRHGRAHGPLQILPNSARALGYVGSDSALATCDAGLRYGMAHLARCWHLSGRSYAGAATCHVQGWGRDPHRPVNGYARSYRASVMVAMGRSPDVPDRNGWLQVGSVAMPWAMSGS
jgi:soluble lytic murein transglycosylase-like protein